MELRQSGELHSMPELQTSGNNMYPQEELQNTMEELDNVVVSLQQEPFAQLISNSFDCIPTPSVFQNRYDPENSESEDQCRSEPLINNDSPNIDEDSSTGNKTYNFKKKY